MPGNGTPRHLDGHDGGGALQKRNHENAHDIEESVLFVRGLGHVGSDGANQSVAEQNAEKSSDEGSGNFVSDFFGWATEGAHGDHDAKDCGDDSQAGRESAMVLRAAVGAAES